MTSHLEAETEARVFTPVFTRRLVVFGLFAIGAYSLWLLTADFGELVRSLSAVNTEVVLGGILLSSANYLIRWLRFHYYVRKLGVPVGVGESLTVFLSGFAMTVTPGKAGEVIKSVLIKERHGTAIAITAPVVLAERVTDLAGLALLAAIGCLEFRAGLPVAILGILAVAGLLTVCMVKSFGQLLVRTASRLPYIGRVSDRIEAAYDSLHRLSSPESTLISTMLSVVAWFTHCLALWYLASAFAPGAITVLESCVSYAVPLLGGTLILIPGGLGATEASMTGLLRALSDSALNPSMAIATALLTRLITFWYAIVVGFLALGTWRVLFKTRRGGAAHSSRRSPPAGILSSADAGRR